MEGKRKQRERGNMEQRRMLSYRALESGKRRDWHIRVEAFGILLQASQGLVPVLIGAHKIMCGVDK